MMKLVILILVVTTAFSQDYDELIQKGYENIDNYEVALESFEKAKSLADEGSKEYGKACYYIGIIKSGNLEYQEAMKNLVVSETLLEGDKLLSYVYLEMSGIYYEYQDYINSLNYLNKLNGFDLTKEQEDLASYQKAQIYYMLNDEKSFSSLIEYHKNSTYENNFKLLLCNFKIDKNDLESARVIINELHTELNSNIEYQFAKVRLYQELEELTMVDELLVDLEKTQDPYYYPYINQIKGEVSKNIEEKIRYFNMAYETYKANNQVDRMIDVMLLKMRSSNKTSNNKKVIDSLLMVKNQNVADLYNIYFVTKNELDKTIAEKEYIQKLFYYYIVGSIFLLVVAIIIYYYRKQIKFLSKLKTLLETKQKKLKHSYDHEITPDVELLQLELLSSDIQSEIIYDRLDKLISDVNNQRPIYN